MRNNWQRVDHVPTNNDMWMITESASRHFFRWETFRLMLSAVDILVQWQDDPRQLNDVMIYFLESCRRA